jgi:hypothetical protein
MFCHFPTGFAFSKSVAFAVFIVPRVNCAQCAIMIDWSTSFRLANASHHAWTSSGHQAAIKRPSTSQCGNRLGQVPNIGFNGLQLMSCGPVGAGCRSSCIPASLHAKFTPSHQPLGVSFFASIVDVFGLLLIFSSSSCVASYISAFDNLISFSILSNHNTNKQIGNFGQVKWQIRKRVSKQNCVLLPSHSTSSDLRIQKSIQRTCDSITESVEFSKDMKMTSKVESAADVFMFRMYG